ncbi:MAG: helix-turn-helix domain-containing protein [Desulfurococcaceae archaeon]
MESGKSGMSLSETEVPVLLALYVLGGKGTAKKISEITKIDAQVVRNTLRRLRLKGLVKVHRTVAGGALLLPVIASVDQREKLESRELVYELADTLENILSKYKDSVLRWAKELGIENIEELRKLLEERRKTIQQSPGETE